MVNLVQAWAERYHTVQPDVAVQVAGGGSGVGIAAIVQGLADVAAASREMTTEERARAAQFGSALSEYTVALDALAIYVNAANRIESLSLQDLAGIYGEDGRIDKWSQVGAANPRCRSDAIVRVGRQNSSGTYAYFREAVLGQRREFKMGSIDQSGSKDVVALITNTPCAIGYSGMAYATPGVNVLKIYRGAGSAAVAPTATTAADGSYPLARRLYLYTRAEPSADTRIFVDWTLQTDAQRIARDVGFVPVVVPSR